MHTGVLVTHSCPILCDKPPYLLSPLFYLTLGCPIHSSLKVTVPFNAKGFLLHIDDTLCLRAFPGQACWGVSIPTPSQKLPTND